MAYGADGRFVFHARVTKVCITHIARNITVDTYVVFAVYACTVAYFAVPTAAVGACTCSAVTTLCAKMLFVMH